MANKIKGEVKMQTIQERVHSIAVLCGGSSSERSVSINSGLGAKEALLEAGFEATLLDPAKKEDLLELINGTYDLAFLCLHGRGGEDGCIQGFLDTIGMPYTGSDVESSSLAMNKALSKQVYLAAGIPTPASIALKLNENYDAREIVNQIGEHCVVKASGEGSSVGVYLVEDAETLNAVIAQAFEYDTTVLVEQFVAGAEYTCAVIGNSELEALPIIQIIPQDEFYDYESKYAPGGSKHICPAPLDAALAKEIQEIAKAAHIALGCKGVSRTDFIVDENGKPWVLETNTLPGMTKTSLLPDAARAQGYTFAQLCTKLVEFALE